MIRHRLYFGIIILVVLLVCCSGTQSQKLPVPSPLPLAPTDHTPVESQIEPVTDYDSLIDNLRNTEATVNPVGDITQPFFSVKGLVINVNGEDVQVFEYATADAATSEAETISPDGSSIGTSMVSWVATPHFWNLEKLIVLYVGENESVIAASDYVLDIPVASNLPQ